MRIELRIDRLLVDESLLGKESPGGVRLSLERELTRLLSSPGAAEALQRIGAVDALRPGDLPAARWQRDGLGTRVATVVGRGLGLEAADSESHSRPDRETSIATDLGGGRRASSHAAIQRNHYV